jgi:hypothetical protein
MSERAHVDVVGSFLRVRQWEMVDACGSEGDTVALQHTLRSV